MKVLDQSLAAVHGVQCSASWNLGTCWMAIDYGRTGSR
jgi:hypothetical protein